MPAFGLVAITFLAGAFIAFQSPINAALSRTVGLVEAAFYSFLGGVVVLFAAAMLTGKGDLRAVVNVQPWQLLGGFLGACFMTIFVFVVPRIGISAAIVCSIAGQLVTAMVIDHFGWFGIAQRAVDLRRLLALPLIVAGVYLIQSKAN